MHGEHKGLNLASMWHNKSIGKDGFSQAWSSFVNVYGKIKPALISSNQLLQQSRQTERALVLKCKLAQESAETCWLRSFPLTEGEPVQSASVLF